MIRLALVQVLVLAACLDRTTIDPDPSGSLSTIANCGARGHACANPAIAQCGYDPIQSPDTTCWAAEKQPTRVACASHCLHGPYPRCVSAYARYAHHDVELSCARVPPATDDDEAFADMTCTCSE